MGDRSEISWPQELPGLAAELPMLESLPGLHVRGLASADIAANEFVNFLKIPNTQPVLTFTVATCRLGGGSKQKPWCFSGLSLSLRWAWR